MLKMGGGKGVPFFLFNFVAVLSNPFALNQSYIYNMKKFSSILLLLLLSLIGVTVQAQIMVL